MSVHMNRWINTVTYLKFVWYVCVRGRYSICVFTFCLTSLAFVFAVDIRFVSLLFALLRSQSRSRSYVRTYVASDCSFVLLLTRLTNISHWFKYSEWLKKHLRNFNSFINSCCVLRRYVRSWIQSIFLLLLLLIAIYVRTYVVRSCHSIL